MSIVAWELYITPCILTSAIALSRWYTIRFPLRNFNKSIVKMITASVCLYILTFYTVTLAFDDPSRTGILMMAHLAFNQAPFGIDILESLDENVGMIKTLSATVASLLTIHHISKTTQLPRSNEKAGRRRRSAIKVSLLSAGSALIMVLTMGRVIVTKLELKFTFSIVVYHTVLINFLPIIGSSYNSVIYVWLSHKEIFHGTPNRAASILSVTTARASTQSSIN